MLEDPTTTTWIIDENGDLHCENGPAKISAMGSKFWYIHGIRHRIGGPAVEWHDGDKIWYQHGQRHREDGPAIECARYIEWYYRGKLIPVNNLKDFQAYIRNKAFW